MKGNHHTNQKMSQITFKPSAKDLTQGAERSHFRKYKMAEKILM